MDHEQISIPVGGQKITAALVISAGLMAASMPGARAAHSATIKQRLCEDALRRRVQHGAVVIRGLYRLIVSGEESRRRRHPGDNSHASAGSFFEGVMTAGFPSDSADDAVQANIVVIAPITSGSAQQDKGDSTWIVRRGLADSSCVSFESRGNPGYFLRQRPGNDGKGNSFYSANDSTKYIRHYYGKIYIAGDGGPKSWDATALWSNDTSFVVGPPWWP